MESGNPGPLQIGDMIWIEPGTKTTLYSEAATRIGDTVLLPIVADDFDTHADTALLACWVPFYIEDAKGGSDKYIQGHFVPNYNAGRMPLAALMPPIMAPPAITPDWSTKKSFNRGLCPPTAATTYPDNGRTTATMMAAGTPLNLVQ